MYLNYSKLFTYDAISVSLTLLTGFYGLYEWTWLFKRDLTIIVGVTSNILDM